MNLKILGSGTSTGVPVIGCDCAVCRSSDPRDHRLRASALLTTDNGANLLIDSGPDFRQQMLRIGSPRIDALLLTHSHYDHVGGIDDMRPYCHHYHADPRNDGRNFPVYCQQRVADDLRARVPYCFAGHHYPGAPTFDLNIVHSAWPSFNIGHNTVVPLHIMHARLPILGFRIGRLAYITDCSILPAETLARLRGVDTLVINSLRLAPHMSHMNLEQALSVINEVKPRRALLTHISHDMGLHAQVQPTLPANVDLAYDGLTIEI